jgi:ADP-ribose pyrophosphatase YjhB (NUDIX family)
LPTIELTDEHTLYVDLSTAVGQDGNRLISDDDLERIAKAKFNGELILPLTDSWGISHVTVDHADRFFVDITVYYLNGSPDGPEDKGLIFRIQAPQVIVARQISINGVFKTQVRVVVQLRHGVGRETLEFPGGMVNKGKTLYGVAIKEVKEETGLEVPGNHIIHLGNIDRDGARSVGLTAAALVIVVPADTPDGALTIEAGEHIKRSVWMTIDEIEEYFRTTGFVDGAFAAACMYLRYKQPALWNSEYVPVPASANA